jgi:hypothetical protein
MHNERHYSPRPCDTWCCFQLLTSSLTLILRKCQRKLKIILQPDFHNSSESGIVRPHGPDSACGLLFANPYIRRVSATSSIRICYSGPDEFILLTLYSLTTTLCLPTAIRTGQPRIPSQCASTNRLERRIPSDDINRSIHSLLYILSNDLNSPCAHAHTAACHLPQPK